MPEQWPEPTDADRLAQAWQNIAGKLIADRRFEAVCRLVLHRLRDLEFERRFGAPKLK